MITLLTAGRPSTHESATRAGLASCRAATSLQHIHDAVAHILLEHGTNAPASANREPGGAGLARLYFPEKAAAANIPDQDADVVILGERLELVFRLRPRRL